MPLTIDLIDNIKPHQIKINIADTAAQRKELYKYRYHVYREYNLISENENQLDQDSYDDTSCYHIYATFDDVIIGNLRMITGKVIPTVDHYYIYENMPSIISSCPREKIFEVGRIISTPYHATKLIPRHLILLALFDQCFFLSRQLKMEIVVGALKVRVFDKLVKINFPIKVIESYQLNYNPALHSDPLINFFNEDLTGKICPVFIPKQPAHRFFDHLFSNKLAFRKINDTHVKLKNIHLFNSLLLLNKIRNSKIGAYFLG